MFYTPTHNCTSEQLTSPTLTPATPSTLPLALPSSPAAVYNQQVHHQHPHLQLSPLNNASSTSYAPQSPNTPLHHHPHDALTLPATPYTGSLPLLQLNDTQQYHHLRNQSSETLRHAFTHTVFTPDINSTSARCQQSPVHRPHHVLTHSHHTQCHRNADDSHNDEVRHSKTAKQQIAKHEVLAKSQWLDEQRRASQQRRDEVVRDVRHLPDDMR